MNGLPPQGPLSGRGPVRRPLTWTGILVVFTGLAAWAWAPLDSPDVQVPSFTTPTAPTTTAEQIESDRVALDVSAFRAPLWVAPPAPPAAATAEPAAPLRPPFKLQLLAIIRGQGSDGNGGGGGGHDRALFYDPDHDRVLSVAEGQTIAEATVVERITAAGVTIRDGQIVRTLALREGQKGGAP